MVAKNDEVGANTSTAHDQDQKDSYLDGLLLPELTWEDVYQMASESNNEDSVLPTHERIYATIFYDNRELLRQTIHAELSKAIMEIGSLESQLHLERTSKNNGAQEGISPELLFQYAALMKVTAALTRMSQGEVIPEAIGLHFYETYEKLEAEYRKSLNEKLD